MLVVAQALHRLLAEISRVDAVLFLEHPGKMRRTVEPPVERDFSNAVIEP